MTGIYITVYKPLDQPQLITRMINLSTSDLLLVCISKRKAVFKRVFIKINYVSVF